MLNLLAQLNITHISKIFNTTSNIISKSCLLFFLFSYKSYSYTPTVSTPTLPLSSQLTPLIERVIDTQIVMLLMEGFKRYLL